MCCTDPLPGTAFCSAVAVLAVRPADSFLLSALWAWFTSLKVTPFLSSLHSVPEWEEAALLQSSVPMGGGLDRPALQLDFSLCPTLLHTPPFTLDVLHPQLSQHMMAENPRWHQNLCMEHLDTVNLFVVTHTYSLKHLLILAWNRYYSAGCQIVIFLIPRFLLCLITIEL